MTYKTNTTKALQNNLYLCSCLQLKEWVNMDSPTRLLGRSLCLVITGCCCVIQQVHFEYFMRRITNILHKRNTHIGVLIAHSVSVRMYHKVCDRNPSHGTTPHHVQLLNVDISSSYMVLSPWYLLYSYWIPTRLCGLHLHKSNCHRMPTDIYKDYFSMKRHRPHPGDTIP